MCAGYGLGSGRGPLPLDLEPMSEPSNAARLAEWAKAGRGRASITGRIARNFNPIITAGAGGERALEFGWWWLWLSGSGRATFDAFNSRDDKLLRSWKGPFQHRGLLPATWYVEKKQRFALPQDELFAIAAVTSTVIEEATGAPLLTYSMVTRDAVGEATTVHPRMPLVLPPELHDEWLDPSRVGDATLVDQVRLASDEISEAFRIVEPPAEPEEGPSEATLF